MRRRSSTCTNVTGNTRIRREEFERLPVGRSYQSLVVASPGVVGGSLTGSSNVNALGAPNNANLYIMDSVDTTDPTTGTFGANLNFEAIQEVSVSTSAVSVEYGRGQGAVVNVITKAGTNRFEGSAKYIVINDNWDKQNATTNEVTNASNARVKFDQVNPTYTFTFGGPLWRDKAWFFGSYEYATNTTPRRQTAGPIPEDYQQATENKFLNVRGTYQIASGHQAWVKFFRSPTDGFVIDYWGNAGELEALTGQNQSSNSWAGQWTGAIRDNWAMEAAVGTYTSRIDVTTFENGRIGSNAPVFSQADNRNYNGATFDGYVDRPRQQANIASTWFFNLGSRSHNVKAGIDFQTVESGVALQLSEQPVLHLGVVQSGGRHLRAAVPPRLPGRRLDLDRQELRLLPARQVRRHEPALRRSRRAYREADGQERPRRRHRRHHESGAACVGQLQRDRRRQDHRHRQLRTLLHRHHPELLGRLRRRAAAGQLRQLRVERHCLRAGQPGAHRRQQLRAEPRPRPVVPRRVHYRRAAPGRAQHGLQRAGHQSRLGRPHRRHPDASTPTCRSAAKSSTTARPSESIAARCCTFEKRFANNWNLQASYTYSRTEGNHFDATFTTLGDYLDAQCRTTLDASVGTNGVIPCAEVQDGTNKYGRPIYDRPHNLKLNGAYVRPIRPGQSGGRRPARVGLEAPL